MAKGKKAKPSKGKTITLKMAQNCMDMTRSGNCLDLSFKEISTVPKCLQKLCDLDEINLSRNLIRKIPDFMDHFKKIKVLDLHSNYLEELPVTIGRLQNLQVLNLCNNRLKSLPDELGLLHKLRTLNLGLNQLEALPASVGMLKELRHISLSDNRFTRVPCCLLKLKNLEKINMERNPIHPQKLYSPEVPEPERLCLVKENLLCDECKQRCQDNRIKLHDTYTELPVEGLPDLMRGRKTVKNTQI